MTWANHTKKHISISFPIRRFRPFFFYSSLLGKEEGEGGVWQWIGRTVEAIVSVMAKCTSIRINLFFFSWTGWNTQAREGWAGRNGRRGLLGSSSNGRFFFPGARRVVLHRFSWATLLFLLVLTNLTAIALPIPYEACLLPYAPILHWPRTLGRGCLMTVFRINHEYCIQWDNKRLVRATPNKILPPKKGVRQDSQLSFFRSLFIPTHGIRQCQSARRGARKYSFTHLYSTHTRITSQRGALSCLEVGFHTSKCRKSAATDPEKCRAGGMGGRLI